MCLRENIRKSELEVRKLKKIIALLMIVAVCLSFSACGKVNNCIVYYGESDLYTPMDIDSAVSVIKSEFVFNFDGCTLLTLEYMGDDASKENLDYCIALGDGTQFDESIVFTSSYRTPPNGDEVLPPNEIREYWEWTLARESGGEWELLTYGYP